MRQTDEEKSRKEGARGKLGLTSLFRRRKRMEKDFFEIDDFELDDECSWF